MRNLEIELVVVAVNQQDTIASSVRRLHRHLREQAVGWQLTLVDNGSTDATFAALERVASELGGLRCVRIAHRTARGALRREWAVSPAPTVVFLSVAPDTNLDALLAPAFAHDDPQLGRVARLLTRRTALATLGGIGITAFVTACGSKASTAASNTSESTGSTTRESTGSTTRESTGSTTSTTSAATTATTVAAASVTLAPEMTEGPYYLDLDEVRSDITEDRVGAALALTLRVIDVATGAPIKGAAVDIWHCDANGLYSGFVAQSSGANGGGSAADDGTFLRGTQVSDANGAVTFATIYPGWYQGRTVHIHIKVHVGGSVVHVGQLFFDDDYTDTVYAAATPYSTRSARDTRNSSDSIFSGGGADSTLAVSKQGSGYASTIATGVKTA